MSGLSACICDGRLVDTIRRATISFSVSAWCPRAVRYPYMNRSNSIDHPRCPNDGGPLCWLSAAKGGGGSIDGSAHNSVWWCHGCKKWLVGVGTKQIEGERSGRYSLQIV